MYDPKFYTKRGRLNRYGLACGYIEKTETKVGSCSLYMDGSVIHVTLFNRDTNHRRQFSTHLVKEARKVYSTVRRELLA